jgi:hypothetical protein
VTRQEVRFLPKKKDWFYRIFGCYDTVRRYGHGILEVVQGQKGMKGQ